MAESKNVLSTSDSGFEQEVLKAEGICLVDFWAEWCGPCKMLAPVIEEIADELAGKIKVFKMNVDENPSTPPKYQIRGIPTLILFKAGEPIEQIVGNQPKDAILGTVQKHLS